MSVCVVVRCHTGTWHPQGWEQGEHHSTDPRTAENAPFFTSRGLGSGGTTERSSAKEISDLLPAADANRASHVRGVMGWGVQNTYLKGFRRRLMACLLRSRGSNGEIFILRRRKKKNQVGGPGNKLRMAAARASGGTKTTGDADPLEPFFTFWLPAQSVQKMGGPQDRGF